MALSGPWPALLLAVVSILGAVLMGIAHRGRPTDAAAIAEDPLPEPVTPAAQPVPAQPEPASTVPPQAPPPPVEQRLRVVRDILPGR